jgi:hypothetical protein
VSATHAPHIIEKFGHSKMVLSAGKVEIEPPSKNWIRKKLEGVIG